MHQKSFRQKNTLKYFEEKKCRWKKNDAVKNFEPNNIEYVKFVDLGKWGYYEILA